VRPRLPPPPRVDRPERLAAPARLDRPERLEPPERLAAPAFRFADGRDDPARPPDFFRELAFLAEDFRAPPLLPVDRPGRPLPPASPALPAPSYGVGISVSASSPLLLIRSSVMLASRARDSYRTYPAFSAPTGARGN
jgi:hypothetical protein